MWEWGVLFMWDFEIYSCEIDVIVRFIANCESELCDSCEIYSSLWEQAMLLWDIQLSVRASYVIVRYRDPCESEQCYSREIYSSLWEWAILITFSHWEWAMLFMWDIQFSEEIRCKMAWTQSTPSLPSQPLMLSSYCCSPGLPVLQCCTAADASN